MSTAPNAIDHAPGLERCFQFEATPASYEVSGISGRIPEWLRGSYYINGPTRFERGGRQYKHWLDGDGMVCRLHFGPEAVTFTNRWVESVKRRDEEAAGEFLYRGFGTSFQGDRLHRNVMLEGPVNVAAYRFAGTLLAFGEQTLPYELDPVTLETRGLYDFHGRLNEVTPFAAHAKMDGHLMNFGVNFAAGQPMLNTFEFDPGGHLLKRRRFPLAHQYCNHDMSFTPAPYRVLLRTADHGLHALLPPGRLGDGVARLASGDSRPDRGDAARRASGRRFRGGGGRGLLPAHHQRL